jgi:hypothetical protein
VAKQHACAPRKGRCSAWPGQEPLFCEWEAVELGINPIATLENIY